MLCLILVIWKAGGWGGSSLQAGHLFAIIIRLQFCQRSFTSLQFGLDGAHPVPTAYASPGHARALPADSGDNPHVLDLTVAAPAAAFLLPLPGLMARMQEKIWKMACVFSKAINVTSTKLTEIRN